MNINHFEGQNIYIANCGVYFFANFLEDSYFGLLTPQKYFYYTAYLAQIFFGGMLNETVY